ncbi:MAG TPA: SRPBCC family protein [Ktedonobacterales bacterium]|nr:SRPBCC family protein [Ktedonobacterales bacterium]
MPVSVCPASVVSAPVEKVWALLMQPETYDQWQDLHEAQVTPPGPATLGQTVSGWSKALGRKWPVSLTIESMNAERHQILLRTTLPFGIVVQNQISCAKVDATSCRVQFG